jgi:hypothetical protein
MKKLVIIFCVFLGGIASANAQEIANNAIGLRFGGGNGLGGEISYQKALGSKKQIRSKLRSSQ